VFDIKKNRFIDGRNLKSCEGSIIGVDSVSIITRDSGKNQINIHSTKNTPRDIAIKTNKLKKIINRKNQQIKV